MADEIPKPKRWRWIIAGTSLVVAAFVWWCWLRVDERIIGTWVAVDDPSILLTYSRDGWVANGDLSEQPPPSKRWRWKVRGDRIYEYRPESGLNALWGPVKRAFYAGVKGGDVPGDPSPSVILEVDGNSLRLRHRTWFHGGDSDYELAYTRARTPPE